MDWPSLLILFPAVALGLLLAQRIERRRDDLSALRLLAELLGLYLLVGVALAAAWLLFGGGDEFPSPLAFALIGIPALSRWAEAPALRALNLPLRWTVLGAVLLLPLLGLIGGAALLRPHLRDDVGELLLVMVGLAASLGLLALLWRWLERVWVLPAKSPPNTAPSPTDPPPIFRKGHAGREKGEGPR